MRILIVEDEPSIQAQLATSLREQGYVVDTASDGEEGLYFAKEYPIDLAIIDLGLPKMDGSLLSFRKTNTVSQNDD